MSATPASFGLFGLFGLEGIRAAFEYTSLQFMDKSSLHAGDGHAVVVFPGLGGDANSTAPLRALVNQLGYATYDWARGTNTGPVGDMEPWLDELAARVAQLTAHHAGSVSLIGWSLGGIYARELAKRSSLRVRQVITIGTPFATLGDGGGGWLTASSNGGAAFPNGAPMRLDLPPPVPTTSIYSKSDGVVSWQACVHPVETHQVQNVEVDGSHCGLGWNPAVMSVLADRLAQPERGWGRYA